MSTLGLSAIGASQGGNCTSADTQCRLPGYLHGNYTPWLGQPRGFNRCVNISQDTICFDLGQLASAWNQVGRTNANPDSARLHQGWLRWLKLEQITSVDKGLAVIPPSPFCAPLPMPTYGDVNVQPGGWNMAILEGPWIPGCGGLKLQTQPDPISHIP